MAISDKTRKLLWGRSGNQCAYCRRELVMGATSQDDDSIVGDECHIVAKHHEGSRGDATLPIEELDEYNNLILLCKVHHKMVDDQPNTYTVDVLKVMKREHEIWVQETLQRAGSKTKGQSSPIATRILTGKEALSIAAGALLFDFDYDEPANEEELRLISEFLQTLQDWGDIGEELGQSERVQTGYELSQSINKLDEYGFVVFGRLEKRKYKIGATLDDWSVAVIRIVRKTNPKIVRLGGNEQVRASSPSSADRA